MNDDKFFLDTNIFIYTFDRQAKTKQKTANTLVERALSTGSGHVSWQVMQEFLNVALRKFETPMSPGDARDYLLDVLQPLCAVFASVDLYRDAVTIHEETRFSFYDSLIVASAAAAGCSTLYSEDMQDGRTINGVRLTNPFRE